MKKDDRLNIATDNELLKEKLMSWLPEKGSCITAIKGLAIFRHDEADICENCFYKPSVGVIVQGFKRSVIGNEEYRYGENHSLVTGVDIPAISHIMTASPEHPFLSVSLELDKYLITQLLTEIKYDLSPMNHSLKGISVEKVNPDILNAFLRLTELLDNPEQIPVLAPMIIREIHYRLLTGPQGEYLRMISTQGTRSNQIADAIAWLKENYKSQLQIDALAERINMAPSTFHRHFKQVTTLSPLQFQKRLRLYEAQRLMLTNNVDAGIAALEVGYESATQFNREYKRLFGQPPRRDVNRLQPLIN